jgi:hypothetical protein
MITKAGVPSNKVIVGVGSYGRSFQMTDPNCYGDTCTFTGPLSGATPGRCTGVAGTLSNAEIKEIIQSPTRVQHNILDPKSQTNILVYDNNQWVGWMEPDIVANRISIYQGFNMGGSSTWAVDLDEYMPPPIPQGVDYFIRQIKTGGNPFAQGNRTGNWTSATCDDPGVQGKRVFTPVQRWYMLDCENAWSDALDVWRNLDKPLTTVNFTTSITDTLHVRQKSGCSSLADNSANNCNVGVECNDAVGSGSGDAGISGYEVYNSLISIHQVRAIKAYFLISYSNHWSIPEDIPRLLHRNCA